MTYSIYIAESGSSGNHVSNALAGGSYVLKWVTTSGPYGGGNFYYNSSLYNSAAVFSPSSGNTGTNTSGTATIVAQNPANNGDFATTAYTLRAGSTTGLVHATSPTTTVYRQATTPTAITFSNVGSTSMTVTASGGEYGTMEVRMSSPVTTAFTSSLPVTYTGLSPGTEHTFQARRENSVGTSGTRVGFQSTTGGATGNLSGTNINAISLTSASYDSANTHVASFTWSASPSALYYYTSSSMTPGSGSLNSSASTGGSFTLVAASNTSIGTYGFGYSTTVLRSGSTSGPNLDDHITYIYQRPATPGAIAFSNVTDTSFDATYTSNEGNFGSLLVTAAPTPGNTYSDEGASTTVTKTYSGLSPSTNYTVKCYEANNVAESAVVTASITTSAAADVVPDDIDWQGADSPASRTYSITNATTSTYYQAYWFTTGVTGNTDIYWHLETSSTAQLGTSPTNWITNDTKMTRQLGQVGYIRILSASTEGTWKGAKIVATTGNNSSKSGTTAALGYFNVTTASTGGGGTSTGGGGTATYGLEIRNTSGNVILGSSNRHGGLIATGAVTNQSGGTTLAANATSASITVEGLTTNNSSTIEILLAGATGYGSAYALSVTRGNGSFTVQNLTSDNQTLTYYAVRY